MNPRSAAEVEAWLRAYLAQHFGLAVTASAALASIGLDSRESLELVAGLEEWLGRPIDAGALTRARTLGALATAVIHAGAIDAAAPDAAASAAPRSRFERFVNPALGERLRLLRFDCEFVRGEGTRLYDDAGRATLDFVAGYGAVPFGHNPPEIWDAIAAMRAEATPGLVQPSSLGPAGRLAEALVTLAPPRIAHVTFANSGAEAVEAAIKLCRARTGRLGIISATRSFHGKTLGALSATGNPKYHGRFGAPAPGFATVPFGDAGALRALLAAQGSQTAAFIVEPIQGEGGVIVPPADYLADARAACRDAGALFVLDEVQTGLGRTGHLFGFQADAPELDPDVIVLAKALGGGIVPIGACLATADAYSEEFGLRHSSTFAGNALACTVGLASLARLTRDDGALMAHVAAVGAWFKARLQAVAARFPAHVKAVRGRGLLLGVELACPGDAADPARSVLALAHQQELDAALVATGMLRMFGVRVAPTLNGSAVLRFEPPLTVTQAECAAAADALAATLALVANGDSGRLFRGILTGVAPADDASAVAPTPACPPTPAGLPVHARPPARARTPGHANDRAGAARCAFIAHPLSSHDYQRFDPGLRGLDAAALSEFQAAASALFAPFLAERFALTSPAGAGVAVDVIMLPQTAAELAAMPEPAAAALVQEAVDLARGRGARTIGLGGYTSIVTRNGMAIDCGDASLTTGNGYTVLTAVEGLDLAVKRLGRHWNQLSALVIGANGSIGRGAARLLAERTGRLILAGNPTRALDRPRLVASAAAVLRQIAADRDAPTAARHSLAHRVHEFLVRPDGAPATDEELVRAAERAGKLLLGPFSPHLLAFADVVVAATSSAAPIIDMAALRPAAMLCDVSRPANVAAAQSKTRPDVLVFDGGLVRAPAPVRLERLGLPRGLMYACMAETVLLGLAGVRGRFGADPATMPDYLGVLRDAATTHGFALAELRAFGRTIPADRWDRLRRSARPSSSRCALSA